jgi:RHS repeat-associated protein
VRWFVSIILALSLLGTRELLGAQELGGGSASVATGYDLSGLRATHSDLLASGAWSANPVGETSQARGRPVVNDLLGRVTSLDGWNHTYSCDGLLLSSEPASPSEGSRRSVHAYDALGRRVRTVVQAYVGGQWTAFSATERDFLGRLPLGIETSFVGGSSKSWRFMRGPDASGTLEGAGGARGVLAVLKDASSWKAVASDTLGNVLALAGTNGDFQRRTFDPWGNPLTRNASGNLRFSTLSERRADYDALPLAWASQEVDPDTGLSHYHFREYSPSLGGWLTQDPIGLAGGYLNLRSYLGNRPADALDKEGRFAWVAPGAAIGGIIGGAFGAVVGAVDEYQTNPNASAWDLFKAGGKGLLVGGGAGIVVGSGVGLIAEVAVAGAGAAQAGLGAGGALTMAAHKANEVGIPQLIEAVGNPVPTAPVGAMVRTELGMAKAAGAEAKGAGQLGAKISVAENATARAAAQAGVTSSVRGKLPCPGEANNVEVRQHYLRTLEGIPGKIDGSLPVREQAIQAFQLRNAAKVEARAMMTDRNAAALLDKTDPIPTLQEMVQKVYDGGRGPVGDDMWRAILESSTRSRSSVNQALGVGK